MDIHSPLDRDFDADLDFDLELANRYLIATYNYVHGIKSRIQGSKTLTNIFRPDRTTNFSKLMSLLHQWHSQGIGGFDMRMKAMRLFPSFFVALPPKTAFYDIDGSPMVECLRTLTKSVQSINFDQGTRDPSWVWTEGSASRLDLAFVSSHMASLFDLGGTVVPDHCTGQKLTTSWCGISAVSGLYLHSVLGIWNAGEPIELRLFRRVMLILVRDLYRTIHEVEAFETSDFWFWKVFVAACSLATHWMHADDQTLQRLDRSIKAFIRSWSKAANVVLWEEAELRLMSITWSTSLPQCLAEDVWERVLLE
ncbi:hypothetical protein QQZ08_007599 [Neonectria magnoliae]|uniref:Uncharacterized protein n=1 Tax=Neonectria magnoliae TaxID=2732573 RepID=A0ABR1HYL7_9HYPO